MYVCGGGEEKRKAGVYMGGGEKKKEIKKKMEMGEGECMCAVGERKKER